MATPVRNVKGKENDASRLKAPLSRRSSCHTPFRPNTSRLMITDDADGDSDESDIDLMEEWAEFVGHSFSVYRVSPLSNFDDALLKRYGAILGYEYDNPARASDTHGNFRVKFRKRLNLTHDDSCEDCIEINVDMIVDDADKPVLTAYLLSGCAPKDHFPEFKNLPIMLCRGLKNLAETLRNTLQTMFDCTITEVKFSSQELAWFGAQWTSLGLRKDAKGPQPADKLRKNEVLLQYSLPKYITGIHGIDLTLDGKDLRKLWKKIHKPDSQVLTLDELTLFYTSLQAHIEETMGFKIMKCRLEKLQTDQVTISSNGQVKVHSRYAAKKLYTDQHFTDIFEIMKSSAPRLDEPEYGSSRETSMATSRDSSRDKSLPMI